MDKRTFLKTSAAMGTGAMLTATGFACATEVKENAVLQLPTGDNGDFVLPDLPYAYDALEPYMDQQTVTLHHDKHHAGYVRGLNNANKAIKESVVNDDFSLVKHYERELAFHGAGHLLHAIFWTNMGPKTTQPGTLTKKYLTNAYGGFNPFKSYFSAATRSVEGSGWGILAYSPLRDELVILQAEKHQNQTQWVNIPILVCDVWEHAYYLKYQNRRGDYIDNFFNIINWDDVEHRLEEAVSAYSA